MPQRFCMIDQVVFSHVNLFHLGKNWQSPNIFRHAGFPSVVVFMCASYAQDPSSIMGGNNGLMGNF
jgi:hypothetical protein